MGNLFPHLRNNEEFQHKLWDHLALMANFELDIDYPYEITPAELMHPQPDAIPLPKLEINERHYGRFVHQFIQRIANDPTISNNQTLLLMIANYMKRCYINHNQETVNDSIILNDLYKMSDSRIDLRTQDIKLQDYQPKRNKKR